MVFAQMFGGFANFALTGQKHQHVTAAFARQFVHRIDNTIVQVAFFIVFGGLYWAITHFHRIGAPCDIDNRRGIFTCAKMLGKTTGINRRRGDDNF